MNVMKVLEKITSPELSESGNAKIVLQEASENMRLMEKVLMKLSDAMYESVHNKLASSQSSVAGFQLANALTSTNPRIKKACQERWLAFKKSVRDHIKKNVLGSLCLINYSTNASLVQDSLCPHPAAILCTICIAHVELPCGFWPELITILVDNVNSRYSTESTKLTALVTIGFLIQKIPPEVFGNQLSKLFRAVCHAVRQKSAKLNEVAANTLKKSIRALRLLFDNKDDIYLLMRALGMLIKSSKTDPEVLSGPITSLECLEIVVSTYYEFVASCIDKDLLNALLRTVNNIDSEIRRKSIEIWISLCKQEKDFEKAKTIDSGTEFQKTSIVGFGSGDKMRTNHFPNVMCSDIVKNSAVDLVEMLFQAIVIQPELNADSNEISSCNRAIWAACHCLLLITYYCGEEILDCVYNFIRQNIKSEDWKYCVAAMKVFGCVLKGPNLKKLKEIINLVLPHLPRFVCDSNVRVKRCTAAAIRSMCEGQGVIAEIVYVEPQLKNVLFLLINVLDEEMETAFIGCEALQSWSYNANTQFCTIETGETVIKRNCLTLYLELIVDKLLQKMLLKQWIENEVRSYICCTLEIILEHSIRDHYLVVRSVIDEALQCIENFQIEIKKDGVEEQDINTHVLTSLRSFFTILKPEDSKARADKIIAICCFIFNKNTSSNARIEILEIISIIASEFKEKFVKYMDDVNYIILSELHYQNQNLVYEAVLETTSVVCRALGDLFSPFSDEILYLLTTGCEYYKETLQPKILLAIADIAQEIGANFREHVKIIIPIILQVISYVWNNINSTDDDAKIYVKESRKAVFQISSVIVATFEKDETLECKLSFKAEADYRFN
uniref:Importin subunit beta-1/Transportin-1-like TPR repeats domain-containing protein n=1 Tax=Strigamia maritima TaxID=126957 RepID=T1J0F5_STRMM